LDYFILIHQYLKRFKWTWSVSLVGSVLLIFLVFCVVLLCVFTFWVPCCDVCYNFRIKRMFGSSLPPVVCRRAHFLFTLFVFVCIQWCPTHILLYFCFVFLCLVYPMLPVSLDCPFLFLLRYSLTFICQYLWIVFFDCPFGII
jgi:hypothetical protein